MKKVFLSLAVVFAATLAHSQTVTLSTTGNATNTGGGKNGLDTINLTPCPTEWTPGSGAAWSKETVNFEKCFTIKFKAMFNVVLYTGGDGICVVFGSNINVGTLPNGTGGYLGYYDVHDGTTVIHNPAYKHSVAVEIDNFNDCPADAYLHDCPSTLGDHTTMTENADATPLFPKRLTSETGAASIKDGLFHEYEVSWVPTGPGTGTMTFRRDNHVRFSESYTYSPNILDPTHVHWGFTGGDDYACSAQEITDVRLSDACTGDDTSSCDDKCFWTLHGNHTVEGDFIGTINDRNFKIRTNNTQWAVIDKEGETGIHVADPSTTLDVNGVPSYAPAPSGVRLRNLPQGQGFPLVVDADGYVYIANSQVVSVGTGIVPSTDAINTQTNTISSMQNQINDLTQQLQQLRAQLNGGTTVGGNSLSVTPNPTSGQVTAVYAIAAPYQNALIQISDAVTGKTIISSQVTGNNGSQQMIMPSGLASGQFLISLIVDGNTIATQKLIFISK